jgi:hypothetical protein
MPGVLIVGFAASVPLLLALWLGQRWGQRLHRGGSRLPPAASGQPRNPRAPALGAEGFDRGSRPLLALVMAGPVAGASWLLLRAIPIDGPQWQMELLLMVVSLALALIFVVLTCPMPGRPSWASSRQAENDAERRAAQAVIQSLAPLREHGWDVLHAVQGRGFVFDHIVLGPSALFAIDTRLLVPPASHDGQPARVQFDGERLQFPDHLETRAPDQARARALWLADQLGARLGEPIKVVPVLALPGWHIDHVGRVNRPNLLVRSADPASPDEWPDDGTPIAPELRRRVLDLLRCGLPAVVASRRRTDARPSLRVAA